MCTKPDIVVTRQTLDLQITIDYRTFSIAYIRFSVRMVRSVLWDLRSYMMGVLITYCQLNTDICVDLWITDGLESCLRWDGGRYGGVGGWLFVFHHPVLNHTYIHVVLLPASRNLVESGKRL